MSELAVVRLVVLVLGAGILAYSAARSQVRLVRFGLLVFASLNIAVLVFLVINQIDYPLNLDLMEGTVLQHYRRAAAGLAIYPEPSPDFVPLAYNPLYYVIAIPFGWVFGESLIMLRLVALIAFCGSGAIVFLAVRQQTRSYWWAFTGGGLFAAAYAVMDAYLNTAHSDSWFLFCALLGTYLISLKKGFGVDIAAVLILAAAFWFKQHGALFTIGGVGYLTWREAQQHALGRILFYWFVAALIGPGLYVVAGRAVFGSQFHYFTWEVPRQWSQFDLDTVYRYVTFILWHYIFLALPAGLLVMWIALRERTTLNVWHMQFVAAALTGVLGSLDPGSADNVYIPMGTWFIIVGLFALYEVQERWSKLTKYGLHYVFIFLTFIVFLYDPRPLTASRHAAARYDDLIVTLDSLDTVLISGPWQGQLPEGFTLYPAVHWVALEDMIRGPGRDTRNHPNTRELLAPLLAPQGRAYILANQPLDEYPWLAFLTEYYVIEIDFGARFEALRTLPRRFDHGYPRYLYRYESIESSSTEGPPG